MSQPIDPSDIPTEDFERLFVQCLVNMIESDGPHGLARRILAIDGIGTILSKELSNDVLEAWEQEKADEKVRAALAVLGTIVDGNEWGVVQVADNAFVDYTSTMGNEIDADGRPVSDPEEL